MANVGGNDGSASAGSPIVGRAMLNVSPGMAGSVGIANVGGNDGSAGAGSPIVGRAKAQRLIRTLW